MKKILLASVFLLNLSILCFTVIGDDEGYTEHSSRLKVSVIKTEIIKPKDLFFQGKVYPISTAILSFEVYGRISFMRDVGYYVHCPVAGSQSKVYREGAVVAALDGERERIAKNKALVAVDIAKTNLEHLYNEYKRNKGLVQRDAISDEVFQKANNDYQVAKLSYEMAKKTYDQAAYDFQTCFLTTPITGVVKKNFESIGKWIEDGSDVTEVMEIDSVYIKLEIPMQVIHLVQNKCRAVVFPMKHKTPFFSNVSFKPTDRNHIYIYLKNNPTPNLDKKFNKTPRIYNIYELKNFSDSDALAIPKRALRYTQNGFFVFKAEQVNSDKILSYEDSKENLKFYKIKKININPNEATETTVTDEGKVITVYPLDDTGGLNIGDKVVGESSELLKDNQKVLLAKLDWLFYPEQILKVDIPIFTRPGIYVPDTAIVQQGDSDYFVYIAKEGKAYLERVIISGFYGSYFAIVGPNIKPGIKILLDSKSLNKKLYSGKDITVKEILPAPIHLTYEHANIVLESDLEEKKAPNARIENRRRK